MFDFLGLRIFFKDSFTTPIPNGESYLLTIDFEELAKRGLKLEGSIDCNDNGEALVSNVRHPWDSIPSSFTGIAFKVFQGSGFRESACVELKASPAKVMQGHNVYGSDDLRNCALHILDALKKAFPDFCQMLDFSMIDVFRFDATYSAKLGSRDQLQAALASLTRISNRYLRPSRQGEFESTVYFNRDKNNPNTGRTSSLMCYSKLDEIEHQCEDLKKRKHKEKTTRYDRVIEELSSDSLKDFATNRFRWEARCMSRWFDKHDIPKNLFSFLEYIEKFESESNTRFCQWAWETAFADLLDAIQGSTITEVHDHKIMTMLHDLYDTMDAKGKLRQAHAFRLFQVYDRLKHSTYEQVKNTMSKSSFYRSINELMAIGLSKAQLQNLHIDEQTPLAEVITFDFDNQRPSDYVEPDNLGINSAAELRAYLLGDDSLALSETDKVKSLLESHNITSMYARALQAGREVRLSAHKSVSLMIFNDGDLKLVYHDHSHSSKPISQELCNE